MEGTMVGRLSQSHYSGEGMGADYETSTSSGIDGLLAQLEKQICFSQEQLAKLEQRLEYILRPEPTDGNVRGENAVRMNSPLFNALENMLSRVHHLTHKIISLSERVDL